MKVVKPVFLELVKFVFDFVMMYSLSFWHDLEKNLEMGHRKISIKPKIFTQLECYIEYSLFRPLLFVIAL